MKHAPTCMTHEVSDPCEDDCTCGAVHRETVYRRQRSLFNRTLTKEEIDILIGPDGEGIPYGNPEIWLEEVKRKSCGESTTE